MKLITQIARILVGGLFIFSGLIKLNDPLGFSYKLDEYFSEPVLNLPFLQPLSLALAVVLVILEVLLGIALLLGFWRKLTSWLLLLMILFFTFLTFYSAYFNKVNDCGCFGDAIKLTPWESFGKDVILTVLIFIVFFNQRYIKPLLSKTTNGVAMIVATVACSLLAWFVLNHLPVLDFRPYAQGDSIVKGMKPAVEVGKEPPEFATIYTMKNNETGETEKVRSDVYSSEKWYEKENWEIVKGQSETVKIKEGYVPPVHDFVITLNGREVTDSILNLENVFLLITHDFTKADQQPFEKINQFAREAEEAGVFFLGCTSTLPDETEQLRHELQTPFPFASMDGTTLKTIVRSNPGLVLLNEGTVVAKWHHNDIPPFSKVKSMLQ